MDVLKFAAIDIGTNAVRLFIANIIEGDGEYIQTVFNKSSMVRLPIRLGEDVFVDGKISDKKKYKLLKAMKAFKQLMEVQEVIRYRACATSAMREASNSTEIIEQIKNEANINIDVIDGQEEARLLYRSRKIAMIKSDKRYLSIDLGGGSIEFTLFTNQETLLSRSFNIGTIRMLNNKIKKKEFETLKIWLKNIVDKYEPIHLIGSGGNINKLFKISQLKKKEPVPYKKLKYIYQYLDSFSYEDRVKILELNPDRADVIIPASQIFLKIMKWTKAKEIMVPVIGLSDGIVNNEYQLYLNEINN